MKKGKKPGEAQRAREHHLARQARQDALNKLKLGETVTISAWDATAGGGYKNFEVKPATDTYIFSGERVLIHMEDKLHVAHFTDKDGQKVWTSSHNPYYIRWEQILGIVVEKAAS